MSEISTATGETVPEDFRTWRRDRLRQIVGPNGFVCLVSHCRVTGIGERFPDVAGLWSLDPRTGTPLLTATAAEGIQVDGTTVNGTIGLDVDSLITFSPTKTGRLNDIGDPVFVLDVWDTAAATVTQFERIDAYPFDPSWIVDAQVRKADVKNRSFQVDLATEPPRTATRYAPEDVFFDLNNKPYRLSVFTTFTEQLLIVFTDQTSGVGTPSMGRFLILPPTQEGPITLDFNRAIVPNHEFSRHYPCPIATSVDHLPVRVEAGERRPIWRGAVQ